MTATDNYAAEATIIFTLCRTTGKDEAGKIENYINFCLTSNFKV